MTNVKSKESSLLNKTHVISDVQEAQVTMAIILKESKVGLDLEGMDLGIDGKVSIVTLALPNSNVYIFDVYSCPMIMFDGKLHEVLESDRVLKVMHGAFGDAGGLLSNFNVRLRNVYDTQCAFTALQLSDPRLLQQDLIPHTIGLNDLLKFYKISPNGFKKEIQGAYKDTPHLWKTRPLTSELLGYAAADVSNLLALFHRMTKEFALKQNRLLLDNLVYETLFNHVVPLNIRKRRQFRQNQLRRWRTELMNSKRMFPYIEESHGNDYVWRNDYDVPLANAKLMSSGGANSMNRMFNRVHESNSEDKIEVIATKMYQSFNKKFYFDVKQSKSTKFIKISEVNMDQTRNQIHISMSVVGHLRDHLNALLDAHQSTPRHQYRDTHTLKSEVLVKDTRRYFLDLKDNGRARFVTISQLLPVGGKLSSIAFPVADLSPIIRLIGDIQAEHSSGEDIDECPEGNYLRCNNKRFFFNVSKNGKGTFMRISEVVPPTYRASITIPERSWDRFIETFHQTCDLYRSADACLSSDKASSEE